MNADFILLDAKFNAFRNLFVGLLPRIDKGDTDTVWFHKYRLWEFERDLLFACYDTPLSSPVMKKVDRRRFQLQVLMDVAYIQGHLEQFDIIRLIQPYAVTLANDIFEKSADGTEETMLPLIDKIY